MLISLLLCTDGKSPVMIRSISIILATYLFWMHFNIPDNVLGPRDIVIKKADKVYYLEFVRQENKSAGRGL